MGKKEFNAGNAAGYTYLLNIFPKKNMYTKFLDQLLFRKLPKKEGLLQYIDENNSFEAVSITFYFVF